VGSQGRGSSAGWHVRAADGSLGESGSEASRWWWWSEAVTGKAAVDCWRQEQRQEQEQ
jgi:hypothetical protein